MSKHELSPNYELSLYYVVEEKNTKWLGSFWAAVGEKVKQYHNWLISATYEAAAEFDRSLKEKGVLLRKNFLKESLWVGYRGNNAAILPIRAWVKVEDKTRQTSRTDASIKKDQEVGLEQ